MWSGVCILFFVLSSSLCSQTIFVIIIFESVWYEVWVFFRASYNEHCMIWLLCCVFIYFAMFHHSSLFQFKQALTSVKTPSAQPTKTWRSKLSRKSRERARSQKEHKSAFFHFYSTVETQPRAARTVHKAVELGKNLLTWLSFSVDFARVAVSEYFGDFYSSCPFHSSASDQTRLPVCLNNSKLFRYIFANYCHCRGCTQLAR
jgi:hypothetical protein